MGTFTNPDLYHGKNKKSNFFEGWYFKIVDKNNENQFAFIAGISKSPKGNNNHSFIQVLNSKTLNYKYNKFNEESFHFNNKNFKIKVDKSIFALDHIKLNISSKNSVIKGKLKFNNTIKWPDSIINPGSMGFYNYLCFMECYAQVCVLDGNIE
ncbi:MAG: tocopherol cyclase family protein, partial [Clostridium sp.]